MTDISNKKKNANEKDKISILNFMKENSFFFRLTNLNSILNNMSNIKELNPTDQDINIIKNEIQQIKESDKINTDNKVIDVLQIFYDRIKDLIEVKQTNSKKANEIKEIVDNYVGQKRLTLKMISLEYYKKYSKTISRMTISRILRNNLNMRFRKTILKNPKLSEANYILMNFIFLKTICRCLNLGLNIIYLDETGFSLNNTNLRMWRKKDEEILEGPKINSKLKINLIMAIDKNQIIYGQYYFNETIATEEFIDFLEELLKRLSEEEKQLKFLFNIPYNSKFNCIEYAFHLMKIEINNSMIRTISDLKNKIIYLIDDEKINSNMRKIYGYTLEKYLHFYSEEGANFDVESIAKEFLKRKRKRK